MSSYISSNQNRFYVAIEGSYGQAQAVGVINRFPAMHVKAAQTAEVAKRLDKTGTRTHQGYTATGRLRTAFEVRSYLSVWSGAGEPSYGPFFSAACGAAASFSNGLLVASLINSTEIVSAVPHGLLVGSGLSWNNELRFVTAVLNPYTLTFNAPFAVNPHAGMLLGPTVTYRLSSSLPSFTLYDYWSAESRISRLLPGCAVDAMDLIVNGDYHDFRFSGPASDLIDAMSFVSGTAGLLAFPSEPAEANFNASGVPGHLGQAWLGGVPTEFLTLIDAKVQLKNNLELRRNEFGLVRPAAVVPGDRVVSSSFSVLVQDDAQTAALYLAAKQRQPFAAMLQLGQQQGQLMGIYLPQVISEVPDYNDSASRLAWDFTSNVAQGTNDDELFIAFA